MKRKSGRCGCDESIATVRDARALGVCWWCGDIGQDLMRFGWERLHVRCAWKKLGFRTFSVLEMRQRRVRMCCVGPRQMRRLLPVKLFANACRSSGQLLDTGASQDREVSDNVHSHMQKGRRS